MTDTEKSMAESAIEKEQDRVDQSAPLLKNVGGVSGERLVQLIQRIERLEEEKSGLAEDIKEVYGEAKSAGYEVKIMRQIVRLRKMDTQKRMEQQELLDLYAAALGML